MKKILFLILSIVVIGGASAQNYIPVPGYWQYQNLKITNIATLPTDTVHNAPTGSIAVKSGTIYVKLSNNTWAVVSGGGSSGATWGVNITGNITTQADLMNLFNHKVNYTDTSSMLSVYLKSALGVKYSDTASMLSVYLRTANFTKSNIGLGNVANSLQVINAGGVTSIQAGTFATIPSPTIGPTFWWATDTLAFYWTDGTSYHKMTGGSGGGGGGADSTTFVTKTFGSAHYYPLTGNPSNFLTSITSGQVIAALTYTPYNATNPSGFITGNQTITLTPSGDISGTVSGSTALNQTVTVTGLKGKVLPSLTAGILRYTGVAWALDATSVLTAADTVSLSNRINLKVNISDTSSMLSAYLRSALGVKYSDTASMLSVYLRSAAAAGTYATIATVAGKVNVSDTASMLSVYLRSALGVKYSDTASMLSHYFRLPTGSTSQVILGNGTILTSDTTLIPSFFTKVRSEISVLSPVLYNTFNGKISVDTSILVTTTRLNSSIDTFTLLHNAPVIWGQYFVSHDSLVDKGFKNTGNVVFQTATDSIIFANVDLTSLSAANLTSGSIPAARYGATTIPVTAINATGLVGAGGKALLDNGTWGIFSGTGSTDISVVATALLDSIKSSSGATGVFPAATHSLAGAMLPGFLTRGDSIQNFVNTRVGDSVMRWNGKDSFYVLGVGLQNDGNMIVTSHSNFFEVLWGAKVDTTSGATKIPTRGEIARAYPTFSGAVQGNIPFWRSTTTFGSSPLTYDTTAVEVKSSVPLNIISSATYLAHSVASSTLTSGLTVTGVSNSSFSPLNISTTTSDAIFAIIQNNSTNTTGNAASAGITLKTNQATADAFTTYRNGSSAGGAGFISGLTQRFNSKNYYWLAFGSNNSFQSATGLLGIDSSGNVILPKLSGSGTRMVVTDASGNLASQTIPSSGTFVDPTTTPGDEIFKNVLNVADRLPIGTNGQFQTVVSGLPAWATITKSTVGLSAVENTALSTWPGTTNIVNLGTIGAGLWQATKIGLAFGGTNSDLSATGGASQFLKQSSTGAAITVAQPTEGDLSTSDITTNNVSISKHGLVPKLPNDATKFLDGVGGFTTTITSGSFTPLGAGITNISTITPTQCYFQRIGNIVTYSGMITVVTPSTGLFSFEITLPISSNITSGTDLHGTVTSQDGSINAFSPGSAQGDNTTHKALIQTLSTTASGSQFVNFSIQYLID